MDPKDLVPENDQPAAPGFQFRAVAGGIMAVIAVVSAVSFYAFYKTDQVRRDLEAINAFYVPALKHLNLLGGKWFSYQRGFEQSVAFRSWGKYSDSESLDKLRLDRLIDTNLTELKRLAQLSEGTQAARDQEALGVLLKQLDEAAGQESVDVVLLSSHLKAKRFHDAAPIYSRLRQGHIDLSDSLNAVNRALETRIESIQSDATAEMRSSQSIVLALLIGCLLMSLYVLTRLRRWFLPVLEWTRVAQQIALKGIHSGVTFPKVTRSMPNELALLTREFTRMGRTILEREHTIQSQKDKLESLNFRLKEQNERLLKLGSLNERVLNSMAPGLLVLAKGKEGRYRVEQFNDQYCTLFGFTAKEVSSAKADKALRVWPEEARERWLGPALPPEVADQRRLVLGDRVFNLRIQELKSNAGRLFLFEDVTELVRTEEKLAHAGKLVLAGNLSSQVSHELRNPLNSMSLQLEMLEDDLEEATLLGKAALQKRVRMVRDQVDRLDRITQRYLGISKPARLERRVLDLHEVIQNCVSFLSAEIQSAGVEVRLQLMAESPRIIADEDAVSQVLFNLIRNSLDSMRAADVNEKILTIRTKGAGGQVEVFVEDSGAGVAPELRSRLFEPFVTNKPEGHGLGLSVSRQICLEHGGELKLTQPNVFEVSLPKLEGQDATHPDR